MRNRLRLGGLLVLCVAAFPPDKVPAQAWILAQTPVPATAYLFPKPRPPQSELESIDVADYRLQVVDEPGPAGEGNAGQTGNKQLVLRRDFRTEAPDDSLRIPLREGVLAANVVSVRLAEWSSRGLVGAFAVQKGPGFDYYVVLITGPAEVEPLIETHRIYESESPMEIVGVNGRYRLGSVLITLAKTSTNHNGLDFDESVFIFNGCPWNWSQISTTVRKLTK